MIERDEGRFREPHLPSLVPTQSTAAHLVLECSWKHSKLYCTLCIKLYCNGNSKLGGVRVQGAMRCADFAILCYINNTNMHFCVCVSLLRLYDEHPQAVCGQRPESVRDGPHREARTHPDHCPDHWRHSHRHQWVNSLSFRLLILTFFSPKKRTHTHSERPSKLYQPNSKTGKSISQSMIQRLTHIATGTCVHVPLSLSLAVRLL